MTSHVEERPAVVGPDLSPDELKRLSDGFEKSSSQEILSWALDRFHPDIALACSFQAEESVLVDMLSRIRPETKIFYLDTAVLFPETYETRDRFVERYGVQPIRMAASLAMEDQSRLYGDELWKSDPNQCCNIRKVQPLTAALAPLRGWITGIRREQAPTRANAGLVEWDGKFGLVKVSPLATWTSEDVWKYIAENDVPYNPLHDQGYPSIGCTHCTRQVMPGEDPRAGRWSGNDKIECGLHK
jgi:phosphoadenosine phosphosulfate reductase